MNEEELLTFIREQERVVMTLIATDPNSEQRAAAELLVESKQALAENRLAKYPASGGGSTHHSS